MFIFHAINNDVVHLFTVEGELQIHLHHCHHDHDQNQLSEEQTKKKVKLTLKKEQYKDFTS